MSEWTMDDLHAVYREWVSYLPPDDQQEFLGEINEYVAAHSGYDDAWDQMIIEWFRTAEYWRDHPDEAERLASVVGGRGATPDEADTVMETLTRLQQRMVADSDPASTPEDSRKTALLRFGLVFLGGYGAAYGVEHFALRYTPHPSVAQVAAWVFLLVVALELVTFAVVFSTSFVTTINRDRKKRETDERA